MWVTGLVSHFLFLFFLNTIGFVEKQTEIFIYYLT